MLRDIFAFSADGDDTPATSEMLAELAEAFTDPVEGNYDVDAVLFTLALSVIRLERALLERSYEADSLKADILNLETRILQAGVPLGAPE